jgi:hypothetical protein
MLGPAWTRGGRPAVGHWTKGLAEAELRRILTEAQRGTLPGMVRTGVTFEQAAAEWLRYAEHERYVKPSTLGDYRMMVRVLNRSLGHLRLEDITIETLERWREGYIAERSVRFDSLDPGGRFACCCANAVSAIGGSITAARLSGIRTPRTLVTVYATVGACAALAGAIAASREGAATPQVDNTLPLTAIAAVLLGGTALTGGSAGVGAPRSACCSSACCRMG